MKALSTGFYNQTRTIQYSENEQKSNYWNQSSECLYYTSCPTIDSGKIYNREKGRILSKWYQIRWPEE